jgi:hypothetical protein
MPIQGQPLTFALTFLSMMVVMYFVTFMFCILAAVNINCLKDEKVVEKIQIEVFENANIEKDK